MVHISKGFSYFQNYFLSLSRELLTYFFMKAIERPVSTHALPKWNGLKAWEKVMQVKLCS